LIVSQAQDSVHLVSISDSKSLDLTFNRGQSSVNLANMSDSKSLDFAAMQTVKLKKMGLANMSHPKHLDQPLPSFKTMCLILNDPLK